MISMMQVLAAAWSKAHGQVSLNDNVVCWETNMAISRVVLHKLSQASSTFKAKHARPVDTYSMFCISCPYFEFHSV